MPPGSPDGTSEHPAADLFDRWQAQRDGGPKHRASSGETPTIPAPADHSPAPTPALAPASSEAPIVAPTPSKRRETAAPAARSASTTTNVDFAPRRGARRVLGLLVGAGLVGASVAGYLAYDDPSTLSYGVAGTLALLTLVLWAVRAGTATTYLSISSGQLEVRKGGTRHVADLASAYTPIEQVGTPGRRGWQVRIGRPQADPLVIDSTVVDPVAFSAALARFRPQG